GGTREVQYFDKSRMEITNPGGDPSSPWYVTNGLLVVELVTGKLQLGDATFEQHNPAQGNVAGDQDDPTGPTYATIALLLDEPALPDGATITQRVDRDGNITTDPSLAAHGVTAAHHVVVPGIDHQVASPFWAFMQSTGVVYVDGAFVNARLFESDFYATGLPLTEAYWAEVKVAGTYQDVLLQCFERRCLTYTPGNSEGWQVEAGNVGQHYYNWRYAEIPAEEGEPAEEPTDEPTDEPEEPTEEPAPEPALNYEYAGQFGSALDTSTLFDGPSVLEVSESGHLYIFDNASDRVQKYTTGGMFLTKWG